MKNIGEIITELRTERNMGQKELALLLNLSVGTISNYENGVHAPDLNTLSKIADLFNVTADYLLGRTGYRCSPKVLKEYMTTDYTVTDFINTVVTLDPASRTTLISFANYLKSRRTKPRPPAQKSNTPRE